MIYWCKPVVNKEMIDAAINALQNEKLVMGESVFKFEEEFAGYCRASFAISTSSGTNALHIALLALGMAGKEVITSASSFIATPNSVIHANGKPIFVDINSEYTQDLADTQKAITKNTGTLLPVHLYGHPADMQELQGIADKNNLKIIEDACQAHGAEYAGKKCGVLGDVGCFSFYTTKNLTVCGDGGMITTNDEGLAKKMAKLRDCGRASQYVHDEMGYTSRLNTINAAIGRVQLKYLDNWNERRRRVAQLYRKNLGHIKAIVLPPCETSLKEPCYHLFVIRVENRDAFRDYLLANGIQTGANYPLPLHRQPIYMKLRGAGESEFRKSEELSKQAVCLPMHPELTDEEVGLVCEKISRFYGE